LIKVLSVIPNSYRLIFPNTTDLLAPVADGRLLDIPMIVSFPKMAKETASLALEGIPNSSIGAIGISLKKPLNRLKR
jgi:hypothetical protein